jgi:hypothetical protein
MNTEELIDELYLCASTCDACYKACMEEKNVHEMHRCMMLDKECLEICRLSGSLLEEESENADKFLKLCIEICQLCAEECKKHNMEHCQKCAEECERCAEMCLKHEQHIET